MLDTFIIDRIQREKELSKSVGIPLRIEVPIPPPPPERDEPVASSGSAREERGVVEIDFSI